MASFGLFSLEKDLTYRSKPCRRHYVKMKLRALAPFSSRRDLPVVFSFLAGGHRDNAARLFSLLPRDGTRGNKLEDRKF